MRYQALAFLMLVAASAEAQTRPLRTEEATTAPARTIRLEAGGSFMSDEPNFVTGQSRGRWDAGELNLVYSPADNVEIDLAWVARVLTPSDPTFGSVSDWGDVALRAKLRLVGGGEKRTALGARFAVTLPETNQAKGLGPNTLRMSAEMLLTHAFGRAKVHANAGLAIHDEVFTPHSQADLTAYGLALEVAAGKRVAILGEIAGRAGKGLPVVERTHEVRAGLRYRLSSVALDAAVRRGVSDSDGKWGVTAGLAWTARGGKGS